MRKKNKQLIEIERIEWQYQVKLWYRFHKELGRPVWTTKYRDTTVYADNLKNLDTALKSLRDCEED